MIFLKIGEIDTIKEQYAADVLIKAKWRETDMDAVESAVCFMSNNLIYPVKSKFEHDLKHFAVHL